MQRGRVGQHVHINPTLCPQQAGCPRSGRLVRRGRVGQHVHALQRRRPAVGVVAQALLRQVRDLLWALLWHPARKHRLSMSALASLLLPLSNCSAWFTLPCPAVLWHPGRSKHRSCREAVPNALGMGGGMSAGGVPQWPEIPPVGGLGSAQLPQHLHEPDMLCH